MLADKEGIGPIKTEEAIYIAMRVLLNRRKLENIQVKDICEEARIDRAVFYAYFTDKYELLNYCQGAG